MLRLFALAGLVIGFGLGAEYGAKLFGLIGGTVGALACGYIGFRIGCIPHALVLTKLSVNLGRMPLDELRASLKGVNRLIPNYVLLELKCRGEDIDQHLPMILGMMVSHDADLRVRGLAALRSAFPEMAERLGDFPVNGPVMACQEAVNRLSDPG